MEKCFVIKISLRNDGIAEPYQALNWWGRRQC